MRSRGYSQLNRLGRGRMCQAFPCRGQAGENLLLKSLSLWMASAGDVPDNR